ncbi:uncharacterized protein LOC120630973 [Pararge aegeria]|uniref:Jg2057 protein n=1 Tax=Pararge aegeria aegeria TaxID=348720 RepID=A0A8S4RHR9_9NEOP|nr:uncharacterized protein LOC120630973 [Pararge aegeria]CAH2235983.1 jg2057 [Pararge aegeria aegeria]
MGLNAIFLLFLSSLAACDAFNVENEIEARGKGKKIALYVYFADLVVKKIFILKLIYAVVFWIVIHKAGYFLSWFIGYLKEQKKSHAHHEHYAPHYYGHGPYRKESRPYGKESGPYRRESHAIF